MKIMRLFIVLAAACGAFQARAANFYGVSDPTMGEYEGFWTSASGARGRVTAQVRPLSNNRYDGFMLIYRGRNPVAGLNLQPALLQNGEIAFTAQAAAAEEGGDLLAKAEASGAIKNGKLTGTFKGDLGEGRFEAAKSQTRPPNLGAKPPAGAIVLFDGQPGADWDGMGWTVVDGALQVGKGNIKTKTKLDNFRLHLEFRTPYMPAETGQARGNSGVYVQGKYEVQVLDSFGLYPLRDNDCGGVYSVKAPHLNATLPPMEWQTYDITFLSDGPRITVVHNGATVLDNVRIPAKQAKEGTGGGDLSAGFLLLQDHGNPVQFRNIWAEPLKK